MEKHAQMWEAMAVRGVVAILLGLVAVLLPGITLELLVLLFAAYVLLDGFFALLAWWKTKLGLFLVEGLIGVLVAVCMLFWPQATVALFIYLIALWALLTGIIEILAAISLRKVIAKEIFLVLSGIISIIFSLLLFRAPVLGAVAMVWVFGLYAIFFGLMLLGLSFKLKKLK